VRCLLYVGELRTVGTGIGHGEGSRTSVLQFEVLISELATIDGFTTSTVAASKVTSLAHEVGNDPAEN